MPFAPATIPFSVTPERFGVTALRGPSATPGAGRLAASLTATIPLGRCATVVSLGLDPGFSPQGATSLTVTATASSFENGNVFAAMAYATGFAGLRVFVEEFAASGGFQRGVVGPITNVYDARAIVFGYDARIAERRTRSCSIVVSVVPGRFYRAWIDSVQSVFAQAITGPATAVSNFTFDLAPVFFEFR